MKEITKDTIKAVVDERKANGESLLSIENEFVDALRFKFIDVDTYCAAMEIIYADINKD